MGKVGNYDDSSSKAAPHKGHYYRATREVGMPILAFTFENQPWMQRANCKDTNPALFFPGDGDPGGGRPMVASAKEAKQVCRGCEVKGECLEYALKHHIDYGVWGETTARARQKMRRALKAG